ncbi:MAG: phosphatidate cytidylyltransferase [Candidatus Saccharimonadales bacterium]
MNSTTLVNVILTAFGLLFIGSLLCLPLYKFNVRAFVRSALFIKIIFWIPIVAGFIVYMYVPSWAKALIIGILLITALAEYRRNKAYQHKTSYFYLGYIAICFSAIYMLSISTNIDTYTAILALCFGSVMSDVFAYFFGNYLGKHHLPAKFNNRKTYEGVIGQLIGSFIGISLVVVFINVDVPHWYALPIGIGSAFGDLFNSYTKRIVSIKDWGNTLPGHGGVLDRFSSLGSAGLFLLVCIIANNYRY